MTTNSALNGKGTHHPGGQSRCSDEWRGTWNELAVVLEITVSEEDLEEAQTRIMKKPLVR
jgi:hypothetical protein